MSLKSIIQIITLSFFLSRTYSVPVYIFTNPLSYEKNLIQGQFFKLSLTVEFSFPSPRLVPIQKLKTYSALLFTHSWRKNCWIHAFLKGISAMGNAISLVPEVTLSISNDYSHYTTGTSILFCPYITLLSSIYIIRRN